MPKAHTHVVTLCCLTICVTINVIFIQTVTATQRSLFWNSFKNTPRMMASLFYRNIPSIRRKLFALAEKSVELRTCGAFCSVSRAPVPASNESTEHFRAALLHPRKHSLTIETMVLPGAPEENMVKVRVESCAWNDCDVTAFKDEFESLTLPFIPGSQFSAEILDVGPLCSKGFTVGDKVAVFGPPLAGGGLSQQCFVPETECVRINTEKIECRMSPLVKGYANAILAFSKYAPLKQNDDIIIIAGPGGDGMAAIEVATKVFKANVLVVYNTSTVDAIVREESVEKAVSITLGLTKVYEFVRSECKTFRLAYDACNSKYLHVVSDFVPTNGHFLTTDPYFSIEKFIPPYFKKNIGKKLKKSTKAASEDKELEPMANWMEQIKRVDIASYQSNDPQYYEQVINEVYDLFAAEKVDPLISQTYKLAGINKATDFITRRKCLGNVLINVSE